MGTVKYIGNIAALPSSHMGHVNIPACHCGCIPVQNYPGQVKSHTVISLSKSQSPLSLFLLYLHSSRNLRLHINILRPINEVADETLHQDLAEAEST